mmetsp:Transcript_20072/g.41359  ORF Transcript_20072/g.41359 Transcript_20072/m.41359 type:complete len:304 (-) Transcript_20072:434-1345(-)
MGNGNRFVGLLCRRLGNALQKGLERPVEISGIFLEKGKTGIFFQKQVVNNGRRDKRRCLAAGAGTAIGEYSRRRRQNPGRPKADPDFARRSHGIEFVRELHSRPTPLGGGFLEDFEQETGVSQSCIDFQNRHAYWSRNCAALVGIIHGTFVVVPKQPEYASFGWRKNLILSIPVGRRCSRDYPLAPITLDFRTCRNQQIVWERRGFGTEATPVNGSKGALSVDPNGEAIIQNVPSLGTIQKEGDGIPALPGTQVLVDNLTPIPPSRVEPSQKELPLVDAVDLCRLLYPPAPFSKMVEALSQLL